MVRKLFSFARLICSIVVASLSLGSASGAVKENHSRLHVLTSFLPVYCFAANVAGTLATVENLIPGTVEPHDYQLSPGDFRKIAAADLLIINGLGLENWLDKAFRSVDAPPKIVEISAGLDRDVITDSAGAVPNPHIWLDPGLAQRCISNILAALQKADPIHADEFARNASRYQQRLQTLEKDMDRELAPVRSHAFVTYHNAFPYLVRRFNLRLTGIIEETPEVAPSPRYLARLLKKMRQESVHALFGERQSPERLATQIASDLKIHFDELDTLETGIVNANSYEDVMRRNLEAVVAGLL